MKRTKPTYEELELKLKKIKSELEQFKNKPSRTETTSIGKPFAANENLYKTLIETSMDGIVLTDLKGKYIFCNTKHAKLLGYDNPNEIIGADGFSFFSDEAKKNAPKTLQKLFEEGHVENIEFGLIKKDGSRIESEFSATLINDEKGKPANIMCLMRDITKRKYAEQDLQKTKEEAENSELRFRSYIDSAPNGIFIVNEKGNYKEVNKAAETITGYSKEELLSMNLIELIPDYAHETAGMHFQTLLETGKSTGEIPYIKKDSDKTCYWIVDAVKLSDTRFLGYVTDITDRIKTEEALKESEKSLIEAQKIASLGSWKWNLNTNKRIWSDELYRILGYEPHSVVASKEILMERIHPDDRENVNKIFKEFKDKGKFDKTFQHRIIRTDKAERYVQGNLYSVKDKEGKTIKMWGTLNDITELKKTELKLKTQNEELIKSKEILEESEQKFRDFTNSVTDIYFALDKDLNYIFWNKACEIALGYKRKDIIGKNWESFDFNKGYERIAEKYKKIISTNKAQSFEVEFEQEDNKLYYIVNAYPTTRGLVVYLQNITEKKNIEIELINQNSEYEALNEELNQTNEELCTAKEKAEESDRLKTEFLNNMSHEIRTPMNGILGFSQYLSKPNITPEKQKNCINIIQNCGNQLMHIIDDILEISILGTNQVEAEETEVCLNDLLMEQFSIFNIKAKDNKIPLYFKKGLNDERSKIFTDRSKLNTILSNLLENALKFTNNGYIEFGYKLKQDHEPVEIEIYVKDTGIGINPDKQEIIFKRFSQEEKELSKSFGGLGLGLSIAKENAELLGGEINLKSTKGQGSSFYVTIPYKPVYFDNDKQSSKESESGTILIVEDEEVNYLYLDTLIEDYDPNLKILHAKNGDDAIEICRQNNKIDLVLMDLKMSGINGFEATKQIKKMNPQLTIIAQSAYTSKKDKEEAILSGCDDFISKPISEETLLEIVNKYIKTTI